MLVFLGFFLFCFVVKGDAGVLVAVGAVGDDAAVVDAGATCFSGEEVVVAVGADASFVFEGYGDEVAHRYFSCEVGVAVGIGVLFLVCLVFC